MCMQRVRAREERRCERRMRVRGAAGAGVTAGAVDVYVAGEDGQRMRDERQTSGAAGRLRCRTVCTKHKTRLPYGSLVRYLCLIVYTLSSSFFSGLVDFWGEKSSSGVWGEAPYIMVLGRGMGRSPIKTFSLMSGLRARSPAKSASAHMRGAASHFISAAGLCVAAAKYLVYRYTDKSYADADK